MKPVSKINLMAPALNTKEPETLKKYPAAEELFSTQMKRRVNNGKICQFTDEETHGILPDTEIPEEDCPDLLRSYLKELRECSRRGEIVRLTAEEETELAKKAVNGDAKARERLIMCNLPLAVSYAMKFLYCGLEAADLIEEANVGLIRAVSRFDPSQKVRLSTYAHFWIRKTILKAIAEQKNVIRRPEGMMALERRIRRLSDDFEKKFGRTPRPDELARKMKIPVNQINKCLCMNSTLATCSLDAALKDDDDSATLGDLLIDRTAGDPAAYADLGFLRRHLDREMTSCLTPQEETAVRMLFGLERRGSYSLEELSEQTGDIEQAQVKKLIRSAVKKLRRSPGAEISREFLAS